MLTKNSSKLASHLLSQQRRNFRAAVILAGCGVYDGSEITEAVSLLISLSKNGAKYTIFAPNIDQAHVVNHTNGQEMPEKRNVMLESARIARGNIQDLVTIDAQQFDAILVPGGFGAAKNLSSFGFKGEDMTVQSDVESALKQFHQQKKVIGLTCIAPIIAARVFGTKFGGPGLNLTLGKTDKSWPYNGSIDVATKFGNTLNTTIDVDGVLFDNSNNIYTTPAYMREDAKPHEVFEGIDNMVKMIAKSLK